MSIILQKFDELIRGIRFSGLKNTLRTIQYSFYRDQANRAFYRSKNQRYFARDFGAGSVTPGRLINAAPIPSGMCFEFDRLRLEVKFLDGDMLRTTWEIGESPLGCAILKSEWPPVAIKAEPYEDGVILTGPEASIQVRADGGLIFLDPAGKTLRSELPPKFGPESVSLQAMLRPEECLYGLGEQAGRLNLRGSSHRIWNTDPKGSYGPGTDPLYLPLPVYYAAHAQGSYLIFFENAAEARFDFSPAGDPTGLATSTFFGGRLQYYFIPGPIDRALERFTALTGRAPLPPRWSLGYHQCRWGYKTEQDVRAVAAGFTQQQMPASAIHLDIDYMDGYRVFSIDSTRFPDLSALSAEMAQQDIRLVTIVDPAIKKDPHFSVYQSGTQSQVFCKQPDGRPQQGLVWPGWAVFPDFTNPATRDWWGEQYSVLTQAGIRGFWHDMNEPASFSAWGDETLPLATCHDMEGQGGDHTEAHNLYGLLMNRAGYEGLRRLRPDERPWIVSRSGWVGMQRFAWNWTGDTESSWASLRMTIPMILGLGLSGIPYSGPDIGGFSGEPSAELHLRWFQMAAFLPFFRTHSAVGSGRREPWVFGEPYTSVFRSYLKLRYRLLPYLYSLAWESSKKGAPLVRPLFWLDPADPDLWEIDDCFLVGDRLLIAPVLEEECSSRSVRLPSTGWYDWWQDRLFTEKEVQIELEPGLEQIPILVKSGTILPLEGQDHLTLHIYWPVEHDRTTTMNLYSDAGDGYGLGRLDQYTLQGNQQSIEINWSIAAQPPGQEQMGYPFPYSKVELKIHGKSALTAWVDGYAVQIEQNSLLVQTFQKVILRAE